MATYQLCDNCKELVEMIKSTTINHGNCTVDTTCPKCGNTKKETRGFIHYGKDSLGK
jgi:DNA polymerase III alpha subunit (gram-positive type)